MQIKAKDLATDILQNAAGLKAPITAKEITSLAICISKQNGAFRVGNTRTVWLVLGSILYTNTAETIPPIVGVDLTIKLPRDELFDTQQVASHFTREAKKSIGEPGPWFLPADYKQSWAHAIVRPISGYIAIGGVDALPVAHVFDPARNLEQYSLYDLRPLANCPLGCVIFRRGTDGILTAYHRLKWDVWRKVCVPQPSCPVDLAKIRQALQVTEIIPLPGNLPLLTRPHAPTRR